VAYGCLLKGDPTAPFIEAFRDRLREPGWIDSLTVHVEQRDALGSQDMLAASRRERVDKPVEANLGLSNGVIKQVTLAKFCCS
jgi:hypothetical protein